MLLLKTGAAVLVSSLATISTANGASLETRDYPSCTRVDVAPAPSGQILSMRLGGFGGPNPSKTTKWANFKYQDDLDNEGKPPIFPGIIFKLSFVDLIQQHKRVYVVSIDRNTPQARSQNVGPFAFLVKPTDQSQTLDTFTLGHGTCTIALDNNPLTYIEGVDFYKFNR